MNYDTPKGREVGVLGGVFPVVSMRFTYPEFAKAIEKGIKKPVKFVPVESGGMAEYDETYEFQAQYGLYKDTPCPNPKLVALGVKFGSMEEFIAQEVVPRFG
ncbi:NmrA domain-containing protein [Mycena chlorophos]|uniref:NmrA domain-containing protein n=1 Tax=Mycena chlorophos TaxID=658473 RepID=A0A8H6W3G2_MYCCL|nr:NmrA domain-containing protein [Mycena chlorophos]